MNTISLKLRSEFQEYLVSWVVRDIETLFNNYDITPKNIEASLLPSGQRRALVARYYAGVDWTSPKDVKKVLGVYEDVLDYISEQLNEPDRFNTDSESKALTQQFSRMTRWLGNDGFPYDGKKILFQQKTPIELQHDATDLLDPFQFNEYVQRINGSIDEDPALAIGSTKELVEAVLKTILTALPDVTFDKTDDVPRLLSKTQKALKLTPDDIDNAAKGADIIKVLLSNLGQVIYKLAELRNLYGTGHGVEKIRKGLEPRHARLAVGAGITLSSFLLDTFKNRTSQFLR